MKKRDQLIAVFLFQFIQQDFKRIFFQNLFELGSVISDETDSFYNQIIDLPFIISPGKHSIVNGNFNGLSDDFCVDLGLFILDPFFKIDYFFIVIKRINRVFDDCKSFFLSKNQTTFWHKNATIST